MLGNCQWIDIIVSCLYVHCFDGPKQAQSLFTNHKIFICSKCCVVSVSVDCTQDLGCRYNSSPSGAKVVSQAASLVTRTRTGSVIRVTVCPAPDHCSPQ